MAHPVREDGVRRLLGQLDRDVPVIWDEVAEPSKDPRQRWKVACRAWEEHDPSADFHIVLQDDALACEDLLAGLEEALDVLGPEGLVSAYTGTGRPDQYNVRRALRHAAEKGHSWMPTKSLCWGVAIIAPVSTIDDMLKWCSHRSKAQMNADMRIGRYYRDVLGWRTWYTVPSLVDHAEGPSLVGHDGTKRVAHQFHTGSALDVDWTRTPPRGLEIRHTPSRRAA